MTEVQAQTPPAASDKVTMPAGEAPTVAATPVADNTNPNPTITGAKTEMQPGAGGGVDLETIGASDYERLIENMSDEPDDDAPPEGAAVSTEVKPVEQPKPVLDDGEGLLQPGKIPERYKVPTGDDPLLFHTLRFVKESRTAGGKLTAGEAEVMAKKFLGFETAPAAGESAPAGDLAAPAATAPTTGGMLEDLNAALEAATVRFEQAGDAFDPKGQGDALREINRLNREIAHATVEAQKAEAEALVTQSEAQVAFERDWTASESTAHDLFAHVGAADPASAISQKAAEIQQLFAASNDPALQAVYQSPNSPILYYNLAAKELGIVPGVAPQGSAPAAPMSPPKSTPPPVQRQVPVGAALLASSGGTQQPAVTHFNPNTLQTSHDYESYVASLGG